MTKFRKVTDCTKCPCQSKDFESGSECNLGYEMDLEWKKDKELIYCSDKCGLVIVIFSDEEFIKKNAETTKIRPENWETKG